MQSVSASGVRVECGKLRGSWKWGFGRFSAAELGWRGWFGWRLGPVGSCAGSGDAVAGLPVCAE